MSENIAQMFLELQQAWCCDNIHGEPVPVANHTLSEEPFPNTYPDATSCHPLLFYLVF